jgi:hypothetical protein
MPAFNPMAYAARQEKKSWTPAMQAKEDAATTLQNALRAKQAKKTIKGLQLEKIVSWSKYEAEAKKLILYTKQEIIDYEEEYKIEKKTQTGKILKNIIDKLKKNIMELNNSLKNKIILDLSLYSNDFIDDQSYSSFNTIDAQRQSMLNFEKQR